MSSLLGYSVSIAIWAIILFALDKYKNYRADNWKRSFVISTFFYLIVGVPYLYLDFGLSIPVLLVAALIGIPISAVLVRVTGSWMVYPFVDGRKKKK